MSNNGTLDDRRAASLLVAQAHPIHPPGRPLNGLGGAQYGVVNRPAMGEIIQRPADGGVHRAPALDRLLEGAV